MNRIWLAISLGMLAFCGFVARPASAEETGSDDLKAQVKHLVRQLSDADLSKRTAAEELLIAARSRKSSNACRPYDEKTP